MARLILAIAIVVVGAWMNMQAAGESLTDIRDQVSSAAAAARGPRTRRRARPSRAGSAAPTDDAGRAEPLPPPADDPDAPSTTS